MSPFCLQPQISIIMASTHPQPQCPKKILRSQHWSHFWVPAESHRAASKDPFHVLGRRKILEDTKPGHCRKLGVSHRRSFPHISPPAHVLFKDFGLCRSGFAPLTPTFLPKYGAHIIGNAEAGKPVLERTGAFWLLMLCRHRSLFM